MATGTTNHESLASRKTASPDIHICGACKTQFLDLSLFHKHKQQECSVEADQLDNRALTTSNSTQIASVHNTINSTGKFAQLLQTTTHEANKPALCAGSRPKKYKCEHDGCEYTCALPKHLKRHLASHTDERPFHCTMCPAAFKDAGMKRRHERLHSGLKPHKCDQCDYATANISSLRRHVLIHKNEYPHKCKICPYACRTSTQLTIHRLRTHPVDSQLAGALSESTSKLGSDIITKIDEIPYKCQLCNFSCSIKGPLNTHMRIQHSKSASSNVDNYSRSSPEETLLELEKTRLLKAVQSPERCSSDDEQQPQNEIDVNCDKRTRQSERLMSQKGNRPTTSMEKRTAGKSMTTTCATSSSRILNDGHAISDDHLSFECRHRQDRCDDSLPSQVRQVDDIEPTTSIIKIEAEPPKAAFDLVKVEYGVDKIMPDRNDHDQEQAESLHTNLSLDEIKTEPEWGWE